MSKRIKVITIDFWNTLFDSSNGLERNHYRISELKKSLETLGLRVSDEEYEKAMAEAWDYFNTIWKNEQRTISAAQAIDFFWKYFNAPYDEDLMHRLVYIFEHSILDYPPKLIEGVEDSLKILKEKFFLGIVSDTGFSPGIILRELLRKVGIFEYFSAFSFSNETGVAKPNPKAYMTILEQFDCPPEQALHIGDIEETDIIGAKNLKMKAIRFIGNHLDFMNEDAELHSIADFIVTCWKDIPKIISNLEN
ncbi:MAG: HAD family hydrolase [Ignavibacteria bacterium]|nr:HAD family hydrolase [Ignavibacteria bacterium]